MYTIAFSSFLASVKRERETQARDMRKRQEDARFRAVSLGISLCVCHSHTYQ